MVNNINLTQDINSILGVFMKRRVKNAGKKAIELAKDRNIRFSTLSLLIGSIAGIASYYFSKYVPNNYIILVIFAIFSIIYKNTIIRKFDINERGWAFGHIYWPVYISWFATWTYLINM